MDRIIRPALVLSALLAGALLATLVLIAPPTMAATKDPVLLNEVLVTHTGLDNSEYIELYGIPGRSLDGLSLIVVEGSLEGKPGTIIERLDFGPEDVLGTNGFYLVGTSEGLVANYGVVPNVEIPRFYLKNGSQTVALVKTSSIGGDFVTGHEVVMDAVALRDGTLESVSYFRAPVIGRRHEDLPAGARRAVDGVNTGAAADWVASDFYLGAANTPTAGDAPPVWTAQVDSAFISQFSSVLPRPTATPTFTPVLPTATNTPVPPTATPTPLPPTATPANLPPRVIIDQPVVSVDEGDWAVNGGSAVDPDGRVVGLVASVGDVTLDGNALSWTYRAGDGPDGKMVVVRAIDDSGATGLDTFALQVSNVAPVVGALHVPPSPVRVHELVTFGTIFTEPMAVDTHVGSIWWDDGTVCRTNRDSDCSLDQGTGGVGSVTASHSYTEAGIYTINLLLTDDDGGTGASSSSPVVVYDPEGRFVTGGGWIDSPPGAYAPDPSLAGRANFGFVAKYKKGRSEPEGTTEFQFRTADLNFHSDKFDWLVIAGHKAMFKGVGTINGRANYGFLLSASDATLTPSTDVDLLRVKIWDVDDDRVVYDNQVACADLGDDADPCIAIGGGSIVVH